MSPRDTAEAFRSKNGFDRHMKHGAGRLALTGADAAPRRYQKYSFSPIWMFRGK
ncbi:MAG: hypothetical protein HYZ57_20540 [Acidobacteria bacterium]|nr:hypothetical protein [Acidobacteriota bacterium]